MKQHILSLYSLYQRCSLAESFFPAVFVRAFYYKLLYNKLFFIHPKTTIKGIKNIEISNKIDIGIMYVGFMHKNDITLLNIQGKLTIKSNHYSIGRGCRFDIGKNATVIIGEGGYINCNTKLIIMHHLSIGNNCAISWDCQFLDEDFHMISYPDKSRNSNNEIIIGDNVWIGCGVKIYKGTIIPNNCVIAANSVVRGRFTEPSTLIAGMPAKVIKNEVSWY